MLDPEYDKCKNQETERDINFIWHDIDGIHICRAIFICINGKFSRILWVNSVQSFLDDVCVFSMDKSIQTNSV